MEGFGIHGDVQHRRHVHHRRIGGRPERARIGCGEQYLEFWTGIQAGDQDHHVQAHLQEPDVAHQAKDGRQCRLQFVKGGNPGEGWRE